MRTSPIDMQKALKGAEYPADKESLIELARENDAPEDVLDELEQSLEQEQEYDSPAEVMAQLGSD